MKRVLILLLLVNSAAQCQTIITFAGNGVNGSTGDGGAATLASIAAYNCTFDSKGNFYFSEYHKHNVRKVDTFGRVSTVAGTGIPGFNGDGGSATAAMLKSPDGLACDSAGNLYISDRQNYRVRKLDVATGQITTYVGSGIIGDAGDGNSATDAKIFPTELCFDREGNLYISDNTYQKVRKVDPISGVITTVAGTGATGFSGDGGSATLAKLNGPGGIACDNSGNLYIADVQNKRIRMIDKSGVIRTIAGTGLATYTGEGGNATATNIGPLCLVVDDANAIYFTDSTSRVRKITSSGVVQTTAGTGVLGYNGDGIPATIAHLNGPGGIALDKCGNVYFSDNNNFRLRKIVLFEQPCSYLSVPDPMQQASWFVYPIPAEREDSQD